MWGNREAVRNGGWMAPGSLALGVFKKESFWTDPVLEQLWKYRGRRKGWFMWQRTGLSRPSILLPRIEDLYVTLSDHISRDAHHFNVSANARFSLPEGYVSGIWVMMWYNLKHLAGCMLVTACRKYINYRRWPKRFHNCLPVGSDKAALVLQTYLPPYASGMN